MAVLPAYQASPGLIDELAGVITTPITLLGDARGIGNETDSPGTQLLSRFDYHRTVDRDYSQAMKMVMQVGLRSIPIDMSTRVE